MINLRQTLNRWTNRVREAGNIPPDPASEIPDPHQFEDSARGSGIFGRWVLDDAGLPAYDYTLDQNSSDDALYPNTESIERRDHWFQIGNNRITGLVSNGSLVQAYIGDRGGLFLNHHDPKVEYSRWQAIRAALGIVGQGALNILRNRQLSPSQREASAPGIAAMAQAFQTAQVARREANASHSYVGGYAYLDDGTATWATAFDYAPQNSVKQRRYGMGYFETETTHRGITSQRRIYAPDGDDAVLLVDVQLTNTNAQAVELRYYEYWDINIYQMELQWLKAGAFIPIGDAQRRDLNRRFTPQINYCEADHTLRFHQAAPADRPTRDAVDRVNWYPANVFLADLSGTPDAYYDQRADFFGNGDAAAPDAVTQRRNRTDSLLANDPMPFCAVLRRDLTLQANETTHLRFAYGAVEQGKTSLDFLQAYRLDDPFTDMRDGWKKRLAYFSIGSDPALQREMAWHSYSLLSSTVYNEYFNVHLTPQGSAYLYLHGADGVPRDFALYAMALTYLEPALAKDLLRIIMQMTDRETQQIQYAMSGHGLLDGAGIHDKPSDLDIFFLLALWEYLAATGDLDFLNEDVPFYPVGDPESQGFTVLDHLTTALDHLMHKVGLGVNGLIRLSDGDWSDGVLLENVLKFPPRISFKQTLEHGESIMNSQMALFILPRILPFIEATHPDLAQEVKDFTTKLEFNTQEQWTGRWYTRAIMRSYFLNRPIVLHENDINLESQPWALISDLAANGDHVNTLVQSIDTQLDRRSLIGAPLFKGGMIWPAISHLLTWGYTRSHPELAWRSFYRNTFLAHSETFPKIWFHTWSGPDGVNGTDALRNPGGTWTSPVTAMTDFPITNNNPHAMALLAMMRICGVEPTAAGDGLRIAPQKPQRYRLDLPLLQLDVRDNAISGTYRPIADGQRKLYIAVPPNHTLEVRLNGQLVNTTLVEDTVVLELDMTTGHPITFGVHWNT